MDISGKVMGQKSLIPAQDGEKRRKTIGFETVSSVLMDWDVFKGKGSLLECSNKSQWPQRIGKMWKTDNDVAI